MLVRTLRTAIATEFVKACSLPENLPGITRQELSGRPSQFEAQALSSESRVDPATLCLLAILARF